jgi:hypothetical protein
MARDRRQSDTPPQPSTVLETSSVKLQASSFMLEVEVLVSATSLAPDIYLAPFLEHLY